MYLVTNPEPVTSIFWKRTVEKNDGSLHISFVTTLKSDSKKKNVIAIAEQSNTMSGIVSHRSMAGQLYDHRKIDLF